MKNTLVTNIRDNRRKTVVGISGGLQADGESSKTLIIDGVDIKQDTNCPLFVYDGATIKPLVDAFEAGMITKEDIVSIAEKANSTELPQYNVSYKF